MNPQIQALFNRAEDSHQAAKVLLDKGFFNFSAAQSYYTFFYGRGTAAFKGFAVFKPFCSNGSICQGVRKDSNLGSDVSPLDDHCGKTPRDGSLW